MGQEIKTISKIYQNKTILDIDTYNTVLYRNIWSLLLRLSVESGVSLSKTIAVGKVFFMLELSKKSSLTVMQRHFRIHSRKSPLTRKFIHNWYKKLETTGYLHEDKNPGRPSASEKQSVCLCKLPVQKLLRKFCNRNWKWFLTNCTYC